MPSTMSVTKGKRERASTEAESTVRHRSGTTTGGYGTGFIPLLAKKGSACSAE